MSDRECTVDGCGRPLRTWGLCNRHYLRMKRNGTLQAQYARHETPEESFAARTERRGECLIWTGANNGGGYGQISVNGSMQYTHRYAWERINGPIPDGMMIDHRYHCNTLCVEVKHLRIATPAQNTSNRKGKAPHNRSTEFRNITKAKGKYRVQIQKDGKGHHLGEFVSIEEAMRVAEEGRKEMFGEFAGNG